MYVEVARDMRVRPQTSGEERMRRHLSCRQLIIVEASDATLENELGDTD
jgi:hypothetical protein